MACVHEGCGSKEIQRQKASSESIEGHKVHSRGSTSVPMSQMRTDVSGVSKRSEQSASIRPCQRIGSHVVSVGAQLRSGVAGNGESGSALLKNTSLRYSAGRCPTYPRYETGAGLWGSENESSRRRSDEREVCCSRGCIWVSQSMP